MYRDTLRQRLTTGSMTLPVMSALTALTWLLPPSLTEDCTADIRLWWIGLLLTAVVTYAWVECNNRNTLLRVRSRMVGSTFLLLTMACPMLHQADWTSLPALLLLPIYFALFSTYGRPQAVGGSFHVFLMAGVSSLCCPPLLLLALPLLFSLSVQMRALTGRTLGAALLGMILPYWLVFGYALVADRLTEFADYLVAAWQYTPSLPSDAPAWAVGTYLVVAVLSLLSVIHYVRTAYNDKIRTRMFFYAIIGVEVTLICGGALLPCHYRTLLPMLLVNSAPLLGHHYTLSRGRSAEIWFCTSLLILVGLMIANYLGLWNSWLRFW